MPANHVILGWAGGAAEARGHKPGAWTQEGEKCVARCVWCGRVAVADFSRAAAERDEEVYGSAVGEDCDAAPARDRVRSAESTSIDVPLKFHT